MFMCILQYLYPRVNNSTFTLIFVTKTILFCIVVLDAAFKHLTTVLCAIFIEKMPDQPILLIA